MTLLRTSFIVVILLISSPVHWCYSSEYLNLRFKIIKLPENNILIDEPCLPGDRFYLKYTHSKDKTPVLDTFEIKDGSNEGVWIALVQEEYQWYGAGLAFYQREDVSLDFSGKGAITRLNRPMPNFLVRVGSVARQKLEINQKEHDLVDLAGNRSLLMIKVVPSISMKE